MRNKIDSTVKNYMNSLKSKFYFMLRYNEANNFHHISALRR
jgi:hypothetical protein